MSFNIGEHLLADDINKLKQRVKKEVKENEQEYFSGLEATKNIRVKDTSPKSCM